MAVTPETLRLLDGMRVQVYAPVDATAAALIDAWAMAWDEVATEWQAAIADLVAQSKGGAWPARATVLRAERIRRALAITRTQLDALAATLPVRVLQVVPDLVTQTGVLEAQVLASQLPPQAGSFAEMAVQFNRLDPAAVQAIVDRTTRRVHALSRPLSAQAERTMKATLVRGVVVGDNPRTAATLMVNRVRGAFDGGRNRALVIARTEMLDAHRAAARANDRANGEVLGGWQWVASLDRRCCPSCWAKHGTTFPLEEDGPHDHQQGRCTAIPVTKSWADLGFPDVEEPPSVLVDAQATFKGLPEADQVAIMGRARLDALLSGRASWSALSQRRSTPGWRDSYAPTPVRALVA